MLFGYLFTQIFQSGTPCFIVHSSFFCGRGRATRFSSFPGDYRLSDQVNKSLYGFFFILFLAAVILCLDNYMPIPCQSVITQGEQSLLIHFGKGGVVDIKAEMNGAGHLIYILPTGTLGTDWCQFNFMVTKHS